jgi:transposase
VGVYVSLLPWPVTGDEMFALVQPLRSHLKRPLLLMWDRFSGHKKAARLLRDISGGRIHVEFLPAYTPERNGVDHAWGHTTYGEMANFIPHNVDDLADEVAHALLGKHGRYDRLTSFFQHARLEL